MTTKLTKALRLAHRSTASACVIGAVFAASAHAADITSAGPLTQITTTADLNCDVRLAGDAAPEFYAATACGTLASVDGTLHGPANIPAGESASPRTSWTPVSQSPITGDGSAGSPFTLTTIVRGGGLQITQTDRYVLGQQSYRTDLKLDNTGPTAVSGQLYRAGDCFLQDSDSGFGRLGPAGAASCVTRPAPDARIEQFLPITPGSHAYEAEYAEVWQRIGAQLPFDDSCRCAEQIDNGGGLSWAYSLLPGASRTFSHLLTFSPVGTTPLTTTKTVADDTVNGGDSADYTIRIANPNAQPAEVDAVTDTLPAGFTYLAGSTSGVTTANPTVSGSTLRWAGPFTVPGGGELVLRFRATTPNTAGTFTNDAGGEADDVTIAPTGPTAPVTITPQTAAKLAVGDVQVPEGDTGTTPAVFRVSLDMPATAPVTVAFTTADGSANAPADYNAASGTVTFAPGEQAKSISVAVQGDRTDEPDETFSVKLSRPSGATIVDDSGTATILDDDRSGMFLCRGVGLTVLKLRSAVSNADITPCQSDDATKLKLEAKPGRLRLGSKVIGSATKQTPDDLADSAPATGDRAEATARVSKLSLVAGLARIEATVVKSRARARCEGPLGAAPQLSSEGTVTALKINGRRVKVNGSATINVGLGVLQVNHVIRRATSITRRGLSYDSKLLGSGVDLVVAEAKAGYTGNPCR